jgi:hypothetical protein
MNFQLMTLRVKVMGSGKRIKAMSLAKVEGFQLGWVEWAVVSIVNCDGSATVLSW